MCWCSEERPQSASLDIIEEARVMLMLPGLWKLASQNVRGKAVHADGAASVNARR